MESFAQKRPILFGVVFTIAVLAAFLAVGISGSSLIGPSLTNAGGRFLDSAARVVFFVPAAILFGILIKRNGFGATFSTEGFGKGLLAAVPAFLCMVPLVVFFFNLQGVGEELASDAPALVPAFLAQQAATGLFEETLFRGLLLTAFLIRWGATVQGRFLAALVASVPFGLIHLANIFIGMEVQDALVQALVALSPALMFAAVYIYSKSLLLCVILHAVYDVLINGLNLFVRQVNEMADVLDLSFDWLIMVMGPLLAIGVIFRSKPFQIARPEALSHQL